MRRAPKPWGEQLWERVERLLERLEDWPETEADESPGDLLDEIRAVRREMVAENARRAAL